VSVQDAAAQIAARWLLAGDEQPLRILDACAAPGNKTAHIIELSPPEAAVTAVDIEPGRLKTLSDNLERLGLSATVLEADASNPKGWWNGELFDAILLDAPCSATGVVRRHPDIKLLRRASDVDRLRGLQADLLRALWPLLEPGGRLLYVTCSVLAAENDQVVAGFLGAATDAIENNVLPNNNIRDVMRKKGHGYQVLPGTAGLDGFYFACLDKSPAQR
jgi:16S rRNA (cytosine967-C5)-methyltransferase